MLATIKSSFSREITQGLRVRLIALVLLAALPSALLAVQAGFERRGHDGDQASETASRVAVLASAELERLIDGTHNLLVGLSLVPAVRDLASSCPSILAELHASLPRYTVLGVARPDGEYVCSSVPSNAPVSLADRRHFRLAVEGRGFGVGDFVVGRVTGKASLNMGQAILDSNGQVQAVVLAGLDLEAITSLAARADLPDGSAVTVFDRQGVVLMRYPEVDGAVGRSFAETNLFRAIQTQDGSGTIRTNGVDGQQRLYAFAPLLTDTPGGPVVAVGIPTSVAYAQADRALERSLWAVVLVALAAATIAWLGHERVIMRPIGAMIQEARRLTAGDLTARTGLNRASGELGELARALDDMADTLQQRDGERRHAEHALEESRARLQQESERLLSLHGVSARLAGQTGGLDDLLGEVLQSAVELIGGADGATLHLWDEQRRTLMRATALGAPAAYPGRDEHAHDGIVGRVFASGQALIVDDYQRWSGATDPARTGQLQSAFGVPLRHAGRPLGVIMIGAHGERPRPFDDDDVRLVGLFADRAAAAIAATRFYDGLAIQLARFRTLAALNQVIFSTLDHEAVLVEIARAAARLMNAAIASFWLVDEAAQTLELRAFSDDRLGRDQLFRRARFGEGSAGWVALHQQEMRAEDVFADGRVSGLEWYRQHGLRSAFTVPVMRDGHVLAVLSLNGTEPFQFSDADRDVLDTFVTLSALAIQNASLYQGEAAARHVAEEANRSKNEFLSRMSHELRTPLNAILGFAQLLEMSELEPQDVEAVSHVLSAGRHLLGLIDEVLDVARIEAGRLSLRLEPVALADLIPELVDFVSAQARDNAVTIDVQAPGRRVVLADDQRLRQVLLNLLTNAVKYNRHGGKVTVACGDTDNGRVRITVTDTGLGIDAARIPRLFAPFDRLGAERTNVEGTGLGLAISQALAEAMNGGLGVSSSVGVGTSFWVDLDTAPSVEADVQPTPDQPASQPAALAVTPDPGQRYVLYVEDNAQNTRLVQHSLAWRPQVTLLSAATATAGLTLARDHHPALILADLHLPDMSGSEMVTRLRRDRQTANIPIVVLSADASRHQIDSLEAAGARAYMTKPFDVRTFLGLVDEILQEAS